MDKHSSIERSVSLLIFSSENGRDGWSLVKPQEVPEWVKDPDNVGRMLSGESCMKCDEGETGSAWYRAMRVSDYEALQLAQAKRERRAAKRIH